MRARKEAKESPAPQVDTHVRREAVRRILRSRVVSTQEELRSLLAEEGIAVTQATLSRDLARLRAKRVSLPTGGTAYEIDGLEANTDDETLRALHAMVTGFVDTDHLVIVHTLPGGAPAVALAIDRARLQGVAGTIAGDDTIFLAPERKVSPARLAKKLESLWGKRK